MSPTPEARLDLLERLQEQQMAINDMTRQALATLNETLRTHQRTLDTAQRTAGRHDAALAALLTRIAQHDDVLARLDSTLAAIKDLLNRPNGHQEDGAMSTELIDLLRQMFHFQLATIVLVAGLYGYAIYGTIVMTRILRDIQRDARGR